jgi:uncharacterized membrane protein YccC
MSRRQGPQSTDDPFPRTPVSSSASTVPDWLRRTVTLRPTAVPWHDVVRSGVFLPVPMALGLAVGDRPAALYGSLGALLAVLAERSGTTGQRMARIVAAAAGGVASMVLGRHTTGTGLTPLLVVLAFAVVSGVLSSIHPLLSFAGMQLLVQMSIAGGLTIHIRLPVVLAWYAGGVLWVLAGVAAQGAVEKTVTRYRVAAAAVPALLAERIRAGDRTFTTVEAALAETRALLDTAHPLRPRSRAEVRAVRGITERLPAVVTAATAAARTGEDRDMLAGDLMALSANIRDGVFSPGPAPGSFRAPARRPRADYVARVVLCMGLAELLRQHDPAGRGYWILLTVALTLKPDFEPVLARTLRRALGTLLGAVVAVSLLLLPDGWWLLGAVAVAGSGIPYAVRRNYGLFSVLITPIVLILLDLVAPISPDVAGQRVADTFLGCAIVVVAGYLLWPGTWMRPSRTRTADALDALAAWLTATDERDPARTELFRHVSDMQTIAGHGPFEPAVVRRRRAVWSDVATAIAEVAAAAAVDRVAGREARLAMVASDVRQTAERLRGNPTSRLTDPWPFAPGHRGP